MTTRCRLSLQLWTRWVLEEVLYSAALERQYEGVVLHRAVDPARPVAEILMAAARNQVVRQKVELKQLVSGVQLPVGNVPSRAVAGFGQVHAGLSCGEGSASAQTHLVVPGQDGVVVRRAGVLDEQAVEASAAVATAA